MVIDDLLQGGINRRERQYAGYEIMQHDKAARCRQNISIESNDTSQISDLSSLSDVILVF